MADEAHDDQLHPAPAGETAPPVLPPSTGRIAAPGPVVNVVLVVTNGAAWLAQCLDGIAAQTLAPARLVVVDVASTDSSAAIAQAHQPVRERVGDVRLLRLDEPTPVGRAIDAGIAALPAAQDPRSEWVWVLHDDTVARPSALSRLVGAVRRSPSVGVAGPKVVSWDDPRRLVEMGIQVTRSGRRIASPGRGEPDQGQYDHRADVLAVGTCGMLVRRDTHDDLGGFDPSFAEFGADLDFGWRAQLAGHRVIVVPGAVVRDALAGLAGDRPGGRRPREIERRSRRAARQVALARCAPVAAPFLAVWMALSSVVAAVTLLVAKRPRQAWRELGDVAALCHPFAVAGARWRGRRSKRLRRSMLDTLFVTPTAAARTTLDHIQEAITPERSRQRREAALSTETGPVADESEALGVLPASLPHRIATHPGFLSVVAVLAVTVAAWRDQIRAGALSPGNTGLAGGELRAVTTDADGLWHAFRDAWHGAGLGSGAESGPHLAVLAGLTWLAERVPGIAESRSSAGVTIAWLLFLAPLLSAWSAYLAGRVVTSSRAARALAAVAWGTSGVVLSGVAQGRVSVAVAHVLLPFVLAGFTLAATRTGTYTATFATALATAVVGAFVPPLLVVSALAALLLLVLGPGTRRLRALVLLLVPTALLGPWAERFVHDWRLVLSGPGLLDTGAGPAWWSSLVGQPEQVGGRALWLAAPVLLLGLLGLAVRGRSRAESVGVWVAGVVSVLGLLAALAAPRVALGSAETGVGQSATAHLWSGVGLELWVAGLLAGLLAGARVVLGLLHRPFRRWSFVGAVAIVLLAVVPTGLAAGRWAWNGLGEGLTVGQATLPAVAVEQGSGALSNRLLLLRPSDDVVDFVVVGQEPGELLRDLDRQAAVDDRGLVTAVARIVGGRSADSLDSSGLAALGIGFVQVRADADAPLVRRLDASEGLSRLGTSEHGILWKVRALDPAPGVTAATAPSRVRLVDGDGRLLAVVPTTGPHSAVETPLPAGPAGREVVAAEPTEWSSQALVTFDGRRLRPVEGREQPTYAVPVTAGTLKIDLAAAQPWWRLGQLVLVLFVVFMAVPFGNRRSRRRA